jgi:SAM-dependent methyltransferase
MTQAVAPVPAGAAYERIASCRSCGGERLEQIIAFGETPLADGLIAAATTSAEPEIQVPLTVLLCRDCSLVQLAETVSPEVLFCRDYPYFSSISPALMAHFRQSAQAIVASKQLGEKSFVLELASNDGYMLRNFREHGIAVLGIDPADGPAAKANADGIPTLCGFFSRDLAAGLRSEGRRADVVLANNVLAHVPDLNGFVQGIGLVLADEGTAVIEVPYLLDLLEHCEFDTMYHQHLCYFSVTALSKLFSRNGLSLNRVEHTSIHGGSLRLFVEHPIAVDSSVEELLEDEASRRIADMEPYRRFVGRLDALKEETKSLLAALKSDGRSIAGYGAAAKATTFLAYFGIGKETLDYIVDLNPHKVGRFMGGNRIPIESVGILAERRPDYVLILAWNFADEIVRQQEAYVKAGGRMIVPIPRVRVVESAEVAS